MISGLLLKSNITIVAESSGNQTHPFTITTRSEDRYSKKSIVVKLHALYSQSLKLNSGETQIDSKGNQSTLRVYLPQIHSGLQGLDDHQIPT